jgi:mandelamide amidase
VDPADLGAVEAVARMRRGELGAAEYAAALLARCEAGRHLNAFLSLSAEQALADARAADRRRASGRPLGPLHGLPIPVKDSVNTRDHPTTSGTPALRGFRPADDAPVVRALRDAGAIVLGKNNLAELSLGWTSTNAAFGAVRNPHDPARIPGGSSGGTAAAVAGGMAPLGLAEDTCGSIRVPAALCGIAGLRPTTFRYSPRGVMPLTPTFDTVGPHARAVADLALFDSALTGDASELRPPRPADVRLGLSRTHYFGGLDPEVARVVEAALGALARAGVTMIEEDVAEVGALSDAANFPIIFHDSARMIARYLEEFETGVTLEALIAQASPAVRENLEARCRPGGRLWVDEETYAAARDVHRPALQRTFRAHFCRTGVAAIAYPTTLVPATPIGDDQTVTIAGETVAFRTAMSRNIAPSSCAGLPCLVLPAGLTRDGLPVGLELAGPAGTDRELLALGRTLEEILGPPPAPVRRAVSAA